MKAKPTGIANLSSLEREKLEKRFWAKVDKRSEDECWNWTGGLFYDNYGRFKIGYKNCKAHRAAFELSNGRVSGTLKILHSCDNKKCCNPKHLREDTQLQNIYDMLERSPMAANRKLDADDVRYIRRSKRPREILAAEFGVGKQMITDVRTGHRWGHIK